MQQILRILFLLLIAGNGFSKSYDHPDVLFNKGVEAYQKQDIGQAMSYTKKAYLLAPHNTKVRNLLLQIRQDIGLPSIYTSDSFFQKTYTKLFYSVPPQVSGWIGSLLFIIGSILVMLTSIKKIELAHKKVIIPAIFTVCILMMSQSIGYYYLFFNKDYRVLLEETILYEEPNTKSEKLNKLPEGAEITVIEKTGSDFILIRSIDGQEAWIQTNTAPKLW